MPVGVAREIRTKVTNDGVERTCTEELNSVLPLSRTNKTWVCNDFDTGRFQSPVQFSEALMLATTSSTMKLGNGVCFMADFGYFMMKGLWVLYGG
jgi:hypothetical protein